MGHLLLEIFAVANCHLPTGVPVTTIHIYIYMQIDMHIYMYVYIYIYVRNLPEVYRTWNCQHNSHICMRIWMENFILYLLQDDHV